MKLRSTALITTAAMVLLLGAPIQAQDDGSTVSFDDISLGFDASLGTSVNVARIPGQSADLEQPGGPELPSVVFTFYTSASEDTKVPRPASAPATLRLYRVADLAGYPEASMQVDQLRSMLQERPVLASQAANGDQPVVLPFLPVSPVPQTLTGRARYVDSTDLSGISYVVASSFEATPFAANDFTYTFQGLTDDGEWYVAAVFAVDASMFPDKITKKALKRVSNDGEFLTYLAESAQALDAADSSAFSPPLTSVDDLIDSISFGPMGGSEMSEPEPMASEEPATEAPVVSEETPLPSAG